MINHNKHIVGILGSGESALGTVRLAVRHGLNVFLSDSGPITDEVKAELKHLQVAFEEKGHSLNQLIACNEIVKSPGIPNNTSVIVALRKAGMPVISEIEFACRFTKAKIVGITGSNGKTTTTLLTHHLLKSAGFDAVAGGNLGKSMASIISERDPDILVVELSSFQLDDIEQFKPDIAVILNITPDHLDRYDQDMAKYADAKLRICENMDGHDLLIVNGEDVLINERIDGVEARSLKFFTASKTNNGAYVDEGHLIFDCPADIHVFAPNYIPLLGRHNACNQMAAILVAIELGLSFSQILNGLTNFKNAPHRLERVGEFNGIQFINDSKATNVDAVYHALDAMSGDVTWIAGGINKGNDYSKIDELVRDKVKALICLGRDNSHLTERYAGIVETILEVESAEEAVAASYDVSAPGTVALLSPACSSFDLFASYEDRGNRFKQAVQNLILDVQPKKVQS